jgi:N-acetylmuramic acid 6-phosphate (MurNAc-6-P) etherase
MLDLGEEAIERARAELRAVQQAAVKLAILMARFGEDAERAAALLRELDAKAPR